MLEVLEAEGTLTVLDCVGRTVVVSAEPDGVAVLDSFAGEAAVLCGGGSRISSCPNGTKSDAMLREISPELAEVPVIMSGGDFNVESLIALAPDTVILKRSMYDSEAVRKKLEQTGIPYVVSDYSSMEEQIYALRMVGAVFGSEARDRAEAVAAYYEDVIERAEAISSRIPEDARVRVYHSINQAVMTDGSDSLGNDWIRCAGAIDVSAGSEDEMTYENGDYYAGLEQIFAWDPDVMICNEAETKDYLLSDSKWSGLRAVREGKVYNIPVSATRWGQRGSVETFFAVLWLGTVIYPEYYGEIDLRQEVTDFYENIVGISVSDETWEKIISGRGIRNASNNSGS
ncbi:MAG: ABC transporter substrate-binding protein [Anaerovoracaceae bacterium]